MTTTDILESVSQWAIPALILLIILSAARKRVPMYESFVTGAKEGFNVAVMIIPYLVAILFAIKIFIASGIFDDIKYGLTAVMNYVGMGAYTESLDLLPLAMSKPLTGGGSPSANWYRVCGRPPVAGSGATQVGRSAVDEPSRYAR